MTATSIWSSKASNPCHHVKHERHLPATVEVNPKSCLQCAVRAEFRYGLTDSSNLIKSHSQDTTATASEQYQSLQKKYLPVLQ
eukprot:1391280-Amphidinium_carterae.1